MADIQDSIMILVFWSKMEQNKFWSSEDLHAAPQKLSKPEIAKFIFPVFH